MKKCKAICTKTHKRCKHFAILGDYCSVHYNIELRKLNKKKFKLRKLNKKKLE